MSPQQALFPQHTVDRAAGIVETAASVPSTTCAAGKVFRIDAGAARINLPHSPTEPAPAPLHEVSPQEVACEILEEFVYRHGQYSDSYLATEPGRLNFWSRNRRGLISYTLYGRNVLAGGGLFAPADHFAVVSGLFNLSLTNVARICSDRIRKRVARKSLASGE